MKIPSSTPNYVNPYANQAINTNKTPENQENQEKPVETNIAGDSINLSSTTRQMQKISAAAETEPAGREKLVQNLKQQVQTNQYTVNAQQVAEKMIGSIMDELG